MKHIKATCLCGAKRKLVMYQSDIMREAIELTTMSLQRTTSHD
jgi:hypothetical protein